MLFFNRNFDVFRCFVPETNYDSPVPVMFCLCDNIYLYKCDNTNTGTRYFLMFTEQVGITVGSPVNRKREYLVKL